jgi:hypothetical protein
MSPLSVVIVPAATSTVVIFTSSIMRAGFPGRRSPVAKPCNSAWSLDRRVNIVVVPLVSVSPEPLYNVVHRMDKQACKTLSEGLADEFPVGTTSPNLRMNEFDPKQGGKHT